MSGAISRIPDGQAVAIRTTPMAAGFDDLKPVVDAMSGKTAEARKILGELLARAKHPAGNHGK